MGSIPAGDILTALPSDVLKPMSNVETRPHFAFTFCFPISAFCFLALFAAAARCKGDVLFTYDNADELRALAEEFKLETRLVAMKNTHHAEMTELLIGKDLSWCSP